MGDTTDGGATTTGDAGTATTTTTGTGATGTGNQTGTGDGGKGAAPQAAKTFNQEEVDRIVSDRVARERKSFADYDDLKTKAAEFDKLTEAQKSDLQKAQDRAADSERRALQLEADVADARLKSSVISAASRKGIVDPEAAFRLLDRVAVTFDKAGDPTNLDAVLDDLVKSKPYLSGRPGNGSGEGGPRGGSSDKGMTGNEWFHQVATGRKQ